VAREAIGIAIPFLIVSVLAFFRMLSKRAARRRDGIAGSGPARIVDLLASICAVVLIGAIGFGTLWCAIFVCLWIECSTQGRAFFGPNHSLYSGIVAWTGIIGSPLLILVLLWLTWPRKRRRKAKLLSRDPEQITEKESEKRTSQAQDSSLQLSAFCPECGFVENRSAITCPACGRETQQQLGPGKSPSD
jgi:hypothetical protein